MTSHERERFEGQVAVGQSFRAALGPERDAAHVTTPHSGVRLSGIAPKMEREDETLLYPFEAHPDANVSNVLEGPAPASATRLGLGLEPTPREPATEPHLAAADPFDTVATQPRRQSPARDASVGAPLSATRLDVAPPVFSAPRAPADDRTLCSAGVVHTDFEDATHAHFRFDDHPVTSVAGVPRPVGKSVSGWAARMSELALKAALGLGRLFGAKPTR